MNLTPLQIGCVALAVIYILHLHHTIYQERYERRVKDIEEEIDKKLQLLKDKGWKKSD